MTSTRDRQARVARGLGVAAFSLLAGAVIFPALIFVNLGSGSSTEGDVGAPAHVTLADLGLDERVRL